MHLGHHRGGAGEPLLLMHGIGMSRHAFEPLLPYLEAHREVLAVDLPGFGDSAPLPAAEEPHPAAIARAVAAFLDERGLETVHAAGNSLGGWVALELAKLGRARSVCGVSPAGFWNRRERAFSDASLRSTRAFCELLAPVADAVTSTAVGRTLAGTQMFARPWSVPAHAYARNIRNVAEAPGYGPTLDAMSASHFTGGQAVRAPTTIAWGEHDRLLLPRQAQRAVGAVPGARLVWLAGCGHVPTWDDPEQVARVVLETSGTVR